MKQLLYILIPFLILNISNADINTAEAFPNLTFDVPVDLQNAGDGSNRIFVAEQSGKIKVFENNPSVTTSSVFLDLSGKVNYEGEQGLLGFAFHPNFKNNGYFFVKYSKKGNGAGTISRFTAVGNSVDPASEVLFLAYPQPFSNHNGGAIAFDSLGLLYISAGDGGGAGDPGNRAQNRKSFSGKILRINIDSPSLGKKYSIPRTNPFYKNRRGYRQEIFAYGFRNPWRISFDPVTKLLWVADVGQGAQEEIDIVKNGGNYGWKLFEGYAKYSCSRSTCRTSTVRPVYAYSHAVGSSITGGYVYRGNLVPDLKGKYVYGDFVSKKLFYLTKVGAKYKSTSLPAATGGISSFGVDEAKELYYLNYGTGKVFKFIP